MIHRLASLFLEYPDRDTLELRDDIAELVGGIEGPGADELHRFVDWWAVQAPAALERAYVETFDFAKSHGPNMTFYTHGDRRQRGIALLMLKRRYAAAGLTLLDGELPDHLAVMLEFAALAPEEGRALLSEHRPGLELMCASLERAESPWADVLAAVIATLPALSADDRERTLRLAAEGPPTETVGLEPFAPPEYMPEIPSPVGASACDQRRIA
jgi:nitrate reductase delta subunit